MTNSAVSLSISRNRRIAFLVIAALLIPALLLAALEGVLRLVNFGYETDFFIERVENGRTILIQNDNFAWQFFPRSLARNPSPIRFPKEKESGVTRVFLFGESAALGDPKPAFGMARFLQVLLEERYPGDKFEVIPAAMTAINSHALLAIARQCANLDGDYWIIYAGNNEMAGPFGANPLSGPASPSLRLVRTTLALRRSKIGQLLEAVLQMLARKSSSQAWEGLKMFVEHQISPNDPRKERIYANFQENLRDIVALASRRGARPLLCTVASNLKDSGPFASMHRRALNSEQSAKWSQLFTKGKELTNEFGAAIEAYNAAAAIDDGFAELQFRLGVCLANVENATNSAVAFKQARDLDALPFRTDSRMNQIIREVASSSSSAEYLDLEETLSNQSSAGVPGEETFFDHVHFNFSGNYRAARAIAEKLEQMFPAALQEKRSVTWAASQICEQRLALTAWNRRATCEHMLQRLTEAPFTNRVSHQASVDALARVIVDLRKQTTSSAAGEAKAIYDEAIRGRSEDFRLRENYAEFLEGIGQFAEAGAQWQSVTAFIPHHYGAYFQAGRLLGRAKQFDAAEAHLQRALELRPFFPEAQIELGLLRYRQGRPVEALAEYMEARKSRPQDVRLLLHIADALASQGRRGEAIEALREAIRLKPDFWEPHYLLGVELASQEKIAEALEEFRAVVRLRPDYPQAHFNLAVAFAKQGQLAAAAAGFEQTLQLDPEHKAARAYLEQLQKAVAR